MKTKKTLNKKLVLRKETISDLESQQMEFVKGGMTLTDPRVCNTLGECSIYYTKLYTCIAGCPECDIF